MEDSKKNTPGRRIATILLLTGVVILLIMAACFVIHRMKYAVTNAVFVRTDDLVTLGFDRVSGRITCLTKEEGDPVKKGEVLAVLDSRSYKNRLNTLKSQLGSAKKKQEELFLLLDRTRKELRLKTSIAQETILELVEKKKALIEKAEGLAAIIDELERDERRYYSLYSKRVISKKRLESAQTSLTAKRKERAALLNEIKSLQVSIEKARHDLELSKVKKARIKEIEKDIEATQEDIAGLSFQVKDAQEDLEECTLISPIEGRIAKRFVSKGDIVSPQRAVYSIVDPRKIYVLVLLGEKKLHGVEKGCKARIWIDAYPDESFKGVVEAVLPASAATFALIPRDISAGEFTKVAQRIPVRVKITEGRTDLLKVGLGGEVEIRRK